MKCRKFRHGTFMTGQYKMKFPKILLACKSQVKSRTLDKKPLWVAQY